MSDIQVYNDLTGSMSQEDINSENISTILDQLNRNSDNLNNFGTSLAVQGNGSIDINPSDYIGIPAEAFIEVDTTYPYVPLVTATALLNGAYVRLPYYQFDDSGNIAGRLTQSYAGSGPYTILFDSFWYDSSNPLPTIYYNIYQLPSSNT